MTMKKMIAKVKDTCKNKVIIIMLIVIMLAIILAFVLERKDNGVAINSIDNVVPEEVRELYSNIVNVSCLGDLYLGIEYSDDAILVEDIEQKYLINFLFSYLDKHEELDESTTIDIINKTSEKIFYKKIDFVKQINDYKYNKYIYNIKDDVLVRERSKCKSDIKYVSRLYGYSVGSDMLSMDVNIGYIKDGVLFDLQNNKIGKYDGINLEILNDLLKDSVYYRYNYIKAGSDFKLKSVKLNARVKLER